MPVDTLEIKVIDLAVCAGREGIVLLQLVRAAQKTLEGRHGSGRRRDVTRGEGGAVAVGSKSIPRTGLYTCNVESFRHLRMNAVGLCHVRRSDVVAWESWNKDDKVADAPAGDLEHTWALTGSPDYGCNSQPVT